MRAPMIPMPVLCRAVAAVFCIACSAATAQTTVVLPGVFCPANPRLFDDGFEVRVIPHDPSNGSGGATPANVDRVINVPGVGLRTIHVRTPYYYDPAAPLALIVALHGAGGPGTADSAARQARTDWTGFADGHGFIIVAPVGSGASGGWVLNEPAGSGDDLAVILAAIADVESAYNIERSRVYAWGYSAGGAVAHVLALGHPGMIAAYGASAGPLRAAACSVPNDPASPPCASVLAAVPRRIPVDLHVGTGDSLYPEVLDDRTRFTDAGWVLGRDLNFVGFGGGHVYTTAHLKQIGDFVCPFAVAP